MANDYSQVVDALYKAGTLKSANLDREQKNNELAINSALKVYELNQKTNSLDNLLNLGKLADLAEKTGNTQLHNAVKASTDSYISGKMIPSNLQSLLVAGQNQTQQPSGELVQTGESQTKNVFGETTGSTVTSKPKALFDQEQQQKNLEVASGLRKELIANPIVKQFQEMNNYSSKIDSILTGSLSSKDSKTKGISDQALITLFNKMTDPNSVVRESEYARTPEGNSAISQIIGFVEKVKAGGAGITNKERKEIGVVAKRLLDSTGTLYNKELSNYENLSKTYGVDSSAVLGGFNKYGNTNKMKIGNYEVEVS